MTSDAVPVPWKEKPGACPFCQSWERRKVFNKFIRSMQSEPKQYWECSSGTWLFEWLDEKQPGKNGQPLMRCTGIGVIHGNMIWERQPAWWAFNKVEDGYRLDKSRKYKAELARIIALENENRKNGKTRRWDVK